MQVGVYDFYEVENIQNEVCVPFSIVIATSHLKISMSHITSCSHLYLLCGKPGLIFSTTEFYLTLCVIVEARECLSASFIIQEKKQRNIQKKYNTIPIFYSNQK